MTSARKVSLNVFHVKAPHGESGLSKGEEQERALGSLCRVGVRSADCVRTYTAVSVACPGQPSPSRSISTRGWSVALTAAAVLHEFLWWILLNQDFPVLSMTSGPTPIWAMGIVFVREIVPLLIQ